MYKWNWSIEILRYKMRQSRMETQKKAQQARFVCLVGICFFVGWGATFISKYFDKYIKFQIKYTEWSNYNYKWISYNMMMAIDLVYISIGNPYSMHLCICFWSFVHFLVSVFFFCWFNFSLTLRIISSISSFLYKNSKMHCLAWMRPFFRYFSACCKQ